MDQIKIQEWKSPFGVLKIGVFQDELCLCDWKYRRMRSALDMKICSALTADMVVQDHHLHIEVIGQLREYFEQKRQQFELPLKLVGTEFQQKVWQQLQKIPYGQTSSYAKQSVRLGKPDAIRAVASANGANNLTIIVPCHRIIGSDGQMVGYAGGITVKRRLLQLEHAKILATQRTLFEN
jgi:methylated-DNA-[protein]-cysteine S-methyltransferase